MTSKQGLGGDFVKCCNCQNPKGEYIYPCTCQCHDQLAVKGFIRTCTNIKEAPND